MSPTLRRELLRIWVRGVLVIAILLSLPVLYPYFLRAVDPQYERREIAQAQEQRQRAGGDVVVTPSGEVRRAVVYTPASSEVRQSRGLVWWTRLLAAVAGLGMVNQSRRVLRRARFVEGPAMGRATGRP